jgi:quercetin dioxygenase-like cupin family protein
MLGAMTTTTASQAPVVDFLGCRARVLATGGGLGLVDMIEVPAGHMPPLHLHRNEDEGFYVLEGEVSIFLPDRRIDLGPGDFALAPRGVPHAYRVGDAPARWLITSTPGGFERFVTEVADAGEVDPAGLTAIAADHDIEILGPPGTLPS